jgi:hypothetical protein
MAGETLEGIKVEDEDRKILNARFTLLHSAIEELSRFRRNEYEGLLSRLEILESRINTACSEAQLQGAIYGFSAGVLGAIFFVGFIHLWEM